MIRKGVELAIYFGAVIGRGVPIRLLLAHKVTILINIFFRVVKSARKEANEVEFAQNYYF